MTPTVSVIMLTYNRERFLPESIYSVLSQTFREIELILIDDGSDDDTPSLVNQMNDGRIRYFKFPHSGNGSKLRNHGITQSSGKFIAFIDSDDIWQPDKIQRQVDALNSHPDSGYSFTNVIEFANDGTVLKNGIYKRISNNSIEADFFDSHIQNKLVMYISSVVFDRRCLHTLSALSEMFPWTDNDFLHRLSYHYKGYLVNATLTRIRKHSGNVSFQNGQGVVAEMQHLLNEFFSQGMISNRVYRKMMAYYYSVSGKLFSQVKNFTQARKAFAHAAQNDPLNLLNSIRLLLSLLRLT